MLDASQRPDHRFNLDFTLRSLLRSRFVFPRFLPLPLLGAVVGRCCLRGFRRRRLKQLPDDEESVIPARDEFIVGNEGDLADAFRVNPLIREEDRI